MTKRILIILCLVFAIYGDDVTIKGVTLGKTTKVPESIVSFCGYNNHMFIGKLNDSTVYSVNFIPVDDDGSPRRSGIDEFQTIKNGLEHKFGVKLNKSENHGYYNWNHKGYQILLHVSNYNKYMTSPYQLSVAIRKIKLLKIYNQEKQKRANDDM